MTQAMTSDDMKVEMVRRKSVQQRLLLTFKREGELNTKQLEHFGTGVSSRIKELRRAGHRIVCQYIEPGNYRYVYLGNRNDEDDADTSVSEID